MRAWIFVVLPVLALLVLGGAADAAGKRTTVAILRRRARRRGGQNGNHSRAPSGLPSQAAPRFRPVLSQMAVKKLGPALADYKVRDETAPKVGRAAAIAGTDMGIVAHVVAGANKGERRVLIIVMGSKATVPVVNDEVNLPPKKQKGPRKAQVEDAVSTDPMAGREGATAPVPAPAPDETPTPAPSKPRNLRLLFRQSRSQKRKKKRPRRSPRPPQPSRSRSSGRAPGQAAHVRVGRLVRMGQSQVSPQRARGRRLAALRRPRHSRLCLGRGLLSLGEGQCWIFCDIGFTGDFATALSFDVVLRSESASAGPRSTRIRIRRKPRSTRRSLATARASRARIRSGPGPNVSRSGSPPASASGGSNSTTVHTDRVVPTAKYQMLRGGLDTRIPLGSFAILARADFLYLVAIGELGQRAAVDSKSVGGRWGADGTLGILSCHAMARAAPHRQLHGFPIPAQAAAGRARHPREGHGPVPRRALRAVSIVLMPEAITTAAPGPCDPARTAKAGAQEARVRTLPTMEQRPPRVGSSAHSGEKRGRGVKSQTGASRSGG